ncbi:mutator protein MutT [Breznakibacter xylanolyticus]|uniref:Mutator protein MutT n=1 Tax=Breznakibacter xylanolyticus TaxID=990 RepID=A0A2W7NLI4_9BACT|nr:NUDIX domain-containing protein [Breznakibacter xylanolyticus]PZX20373.1 mutator protein MutT [Breznakibacter xylanolyticus]
MTHPGKVLHYCPKCGSREFPFDGHKSFRCRQCDFHFFINTAAAIAAVIENDRGEILLTRRAFAPNQGMLDLPGGFVDPLESAEEALRREIDEELHLEVTQSQYLISFPNEYVFSNFTVYTTDLGFVVRVKDFSHITACDDISGYLFVAPGEIDYTQICAPSIERIIRYYCACRSHDAINQ